MVHMEVKDTGSEYINTWKEYKSADRHQGSCGEILSDIGFGARKLQYRELGDNLLLLFIVFQWNRIVMKSYIEIYYTFTLSKLIKTRM